MKYFPSLSAVMIAAACVSHAQAAIMITDIAGLQNINNDLSADYVLANNIDAAGFRFVPIGIEVADFPFIPSTVKQFAGTLDGKGFKINDLTISYEHYAQIPGHNSFGLFWDIGATGVVKNLGLTNINYSAASGAASVAVGGITGANYGTITNLFTTGTILTRTANM